MANTRLNLLPPDVLLMIAKYSHQPTARFFAPLTKVPTIIRRYVVVDSFLCDVLCGQENLVRAQLSKDSGLLVEVGNGINYSGQRFENYTALQLAWGARDYRMCALLVDAFEQQGMLDIANAQLEAKFPRYRNFERQAFNFAEVRAAFLTNTDVREAVAKFKKDFAPGFVTSGYHFNIYTLDFACHLYDNELAEIDSALREIFWREIIGYLQRLVPAHLASVICFGLHQVVEQNAAMHNRTLNLTETVCYYPLDQNPQERIGYDVAIYANTGGKISKYQARAKVPSSDPNFSLLIKYHLDQELKFNGLRNRMNTPVPPAPGCSIL